MKVFTQNKIIQAVMKRRDELERRNWKVQRRETSLEEHLKNSRRIITTKYRQEVRDEAVEKIVKRKKMNYWFKMMSVHGDQAPAKV